MSDESVILTFELTGEALKYHKLAEAIRRGSKIRPQCKEKLFLDGSSCAIGAAYEGAGFGQTWDIGDWPVKVLLRAGMWPHDLDAYHVSDRNDYLGMTREAIADRLDDVAYGRLAEF